MRDGAAYSSALLQDCASKGEIKRYQKALMLRIAQDVITPLLKQELVN
jgi:hypothetical protein